MKIIAANLVLVDYVRDNPGAKRDLFGLFGAIAPTQFPANSHFWLVGRAVVDAPGGTVMPFLFQTEDPRDVRKLVAEGEAQSGPKNGLGFFDIAIPVSLHCEVPGMHYVVWQLNGTEVSRAAVEVKDVRS